MTYTTDYRRDIDGLRAVAVLSVIFYHYGVPGFGGGFSGVDIFFVISGFLIGGHVMGEIGAGRFSLLRFYERRIRRIFPALFIMLTLVFAAAAMILFPPDLRNFARDAIFVIPFLANVEFYNAAGAYAGAFAQHLALLHTWTLAVEEQFYLLFPLLLLVVARFAQGRYRLVLLPLALTSFVLCAAASRIAPIAAFYLTPFRGWELLAGDLVVLLPPAQLNAAARGGLALTGLLLIALSDVLLTSQTPYPGEYALLPCGGAALLLYAGCDKKLAAGRILDNPVLVRIGLWSYSLYLFHWPVLVLARYYAFEPLTIAARCLLLAGTFLLAAFSWRFVEQPFRGPGGFFGRPRLFAAAFACAGALLSVAVVMHWAYSGPRWLSPWERGLFPFQTEAQNKCAGATPRPAFAPPCKLGDPAAPVSAILWGDSHALALLPAMAAVFAEHNQAAAFAELASCPPLLGVRPGSPQANRSLAFPIQGAAGQGEDCERHNDAVLAWVTQSGIGTVVLAGHWRVYAGNDRRSGVLILSDRELPHPATLADNSAVFQRGFERLLQALQPGHVRTFVVEDVPQMDANVPYALASSERLGTHPDFGLTRAAYEMQQQTVTQIFTQLQSRYPFDLLRPQDLLCAGNRCAVTRHGQSLYQDDEHLSPAGAIMIEPIFEKIWQ